MSVNAYGQDRGLAVFVLVQPEFLKRGWGGLDALGVRR